MVFRVLFSRIKDHCKFRKVGENFFVFSHVLFIFLSQGPRMMANYFSRNSLFEMNKRSDVGI